MLDRHLTELLERRLATTPAVVLLGPRQVGKTTLARAIASRHPESVFLDLERESDRAAVAQPELFFPAHRDRLVVLGEVQLAPELFAALRPEIDDDRRAGRFLLLSSASGALLRQSGESLAGRVACLELTPLLVSELQPDPVGLQSLWLRGGYPLSHLAADDEASYAWRLDFVRTFLNRDLPEMGVRVPAETLRRFWQMLANLQGQLFNASQLGLSLGGASHTTVARYLDALIDTMMVRRLAPHLPNVGKRLVKSPKVYLRDSGLLHALLGIASVKDLQGHPIAGASWEGFVMEQIAAHLPPDAQLGFYRTAAGAELDAVVERGTKTIAIEIKFSAAPKPTKGFWNALQDLQADRAYVIAPVQRRYRLAEGVEVVPVEAIPAMFS
ncbi:ATP-binding protein [Methylibium sp.]|uniref:ATP-binding protein n=1 Tax=Methylibium sp. TaxID=2067992 RepID=UPI0018512F03|nr:ATP-binding protein [Methylibium sp.]MBA3588097.1 ATP-binding protein [Methylibium sp.]